MTGLDEAIEFFARERIPMLPCHGLKDGQCTCRRGKNCHSPGKHPLMSNWQGVASSDPAKVKAWFRSSKPVNLAIATGRKGKNEKYLVALDADAIDHPFINNLKQYGETVTQRSGSGGSHALYWSDVPVKNSCQMLDEKLDVRGLGGILVVAPSSHKSGNKYQFTCNLKEVQLLEMPRFLQEKLSTAVALAKKSRPRRVVGPRVEKVELQRLTQEWSTRSITEIRDSIIAGTVQVPFGIRNTTMHRLLSSDRAKGADKMALESKVLSYLPSFQDAYNFLDEATEIIDSVLKYQPYNTSHERVNEIYVGWLKKKGLTADCSIETMDALDKEFFERVSPTKGEETISLSIKEIADFRGRFFFSRGHQRFSAYKSQLLAKKLLSCGVRKRRTAKNNVWEVSKRIWGVEESKQAGYPAPKEESMEENRKVKDGDIIEQNGQKMRVEILKREIPRDEHPKEHFFRGRFGIDFNLANARYLAQLTDETREEYENGTLVMNQEATLTALSGILPGDIIGFGCSTYRVVDKLDGKLRLMPVVKIRVPNKVGQFEDVGEETDIEEPSLHSLDRFRELGFLMVLWRDGVPFGVDSNKNINIVLFHPVDNQEKEEIQDDSSS